MRNKFIHQAARALRLLTVIVFSFGFSALAQEYTVRDVPNVILSDSLRLTSDPNGILSERELEEIDRRLVSLRRVYDIEVGIVLLPSIGQRDVESFSTELFRSWGIGDKHSNSGLLIFLVIDQRKLRFEVGYGLEGVLTDAMSKRIQQGAMIPYIRQGAYAEGILSGISEIDRLFAREWQRPDKSTPERESIDLSAILIVYGLLLIVVLLWLGNELSRQLASVRTPNEARRHRQELENAFRSAIVIFLILCFPVSMVLLLWRLYAMRRINHLSQKCAHCHHSGTIQELHSPEKQRYLTRGQDIEEKLGSKLHRVYLCSTCHTPEVSSTVIGQKQIRSCPRCGYHTLQIQPTRYIGRNSLRLMRIERRCLNCDYNDHEDHRLKEQDSSNELLGTLLLAGLLGSARSSGGHGDFGGGFTGGNFGGGSSGGGGATSEW